MSCPPCHGRNASSPLRRDVVFRGARLDAMVGRHDTSWDEPGLASPPTSSSVDCGGHWRRCYELEISPEFAMRNSMPRFEPS